MFSYTYRLGGLLQLQIICDIYTSGKCSTTSDWCSWQVHCPRPVNNSKRESEDSAILSGVIIVVFVIRNIKKDTIVLVITKGPRHSRLFYFLWQYVTPGRFQLNFKLFISSYLDNSGSYYGLLTSRSNKITTFTVNNFFFAATLFRD